MQLRNQATCSHTLYTIALGISALKYRRISVERNSVIGIFHCDPSVHTRESIYWTLKISMIVTRWNAANFSSKVAQSQFTEGQTGRAAQPFRFCYCSAKGANRAGDGWFSFETQTRNMKYFKMVKRISVLGTENIVGLAMLIMDSAEGVEVVGAEALIGTQNPFTWVWISIANNYVVIKRDPEDRRPLGEEKDMVNGEDDCGLEPVTFHKPRVGLMF
ncbi:hypothetical protein BDN67DRAFT_982245 [Paxillus ammoniavirescens]|nr:hypothetical protein BDN67DRAFT_982245 [Paxillus ammoniavirescens]